MTAQQLGTDGYAARLIGYHPTNLCYQLVAEPAVAPEHPHDPAGSPDPAVGVHAVINALPWEGNPEGRMSGALLWHPVELGNWTGTRAEFAAADPQEQSTALAAGPAYRDGRWGTHLGATLSVVTSDGLTVLRSRAGKYAEDHLYDSLIAGTMMLPDMPDSQDPITLDYLRLLLYRTNISMSRDVEEIHPTHLAIRTTDFGLWLGGWVQLGLTAAQVKAVVPFDTVAVDLDNSSGVPITDWGAFDLHAMRTHLDGRCLVPPIAQP